MHLKVREPDEEGRWDRGKKRERDREKQETERQRDLPSACSLPRCPPATARAMRGQSQELEAQSRPLTKGST